MGEKGEALKKVRGAAIRNALRRVKWLVKPRRQHISLDGCAVAIRRNDDLESRQKVLRKMLPIAMMSSASPQVPNKENRGGRP